MFGRAVGPNYLNVVLNLTDPYLFFSDRTFHAYRAFQSGKRPTFCASATPISGLQGSKIVMNSVGFSFFLNFSEREDA